MGAARRTVGPNVGSADLRRDSWFARTCASAAQPRSGENPWSRQGAFAQHAPARRLAANRA